jgi:potassium-dependent mechanosensitive channel
MSRTLITILVATLMFAPRVVNAETSTDAPQPAVSAHSTSVADTVTQAIASEDLQRAALARLEQAGLWRGLSDRVAALEEEFESLAAGAMSKPELINSIELDRHLRGLHREAATIADNIAEIVRRLERDDNLLGASARKWEERASFLESQSVPAAVLERARSIKTKLQHANARVRELRDNALLGLDRALALQARLEDARALIAARQARLSAQRLLLEQSPIWRLGAASAQFELVGAEFSSTWKIQRDYLAQDGAGLVGLFFFILVLTAWLFTRRAGVASEPIQRAYGRPFAASLLIALVSLGWLAPNPPRFFFGVLFLLVPIPAAMVARRAITVPIPLTLFGIALSMMLFSLRGLVTASPLADRILLLLQVICVALPIVIDLRHGRLQQAFHWTSPGVVRAVALVMLAAAALTGFHAVFGFSGPAGSLRAGMGSFLGAVLVFGTTAVVLYGAVLAFLATPIAQWFHSARNADAAMLCTLRFVITVLAIISVVTVSIGSLGLIPAMNSASESLMGTTLEVGTVSISLKSVATALAVIFATVVLSGIVGFMLDREIVPRLHLRPGAAYAIVTFTRWSMLIVGAVFALAALGIDMTKITLLAGALSVGIGFGLQHVINNFVSGLILIVERPIGVGDVIEWGSQSGTIVRIGIRSSTVRTGQGAEILVPNGDLVSKEVVNWTRSDRQRRYDIDVGVALGSEPEQVMRLLAEAAGDVPEISKAPPPRVVFKGIGETSLNFTLLAWVATVDVGVQAQNALRVAMLKKLEEAGIAPFSQHDLEIRTAEVPAPKAPG